MEMSVFVVDEAFFDGIASLLQMKITKYTAKRPFSYVKVI